MTSSAFRSLLAAAALATVAASLPIASATAQTPALVVRDSTGARLGQLLDVDVTEINYDEAVVGQTIMTVDGQTFAIRLHRHDFMGASGYLLFESADCTGTPWAPLTLKYDLVHPAFLLPGNKAWVPLMRAPVVRMINSTAVVLSGTIQQCDAAGIEYDVLPMRALGNLKNRFPPPFRIEPDA